ncbi:MULTISPECIES: LysE family translocator [unclassified Brevundimonas]|uniref:LysE family translocator n=1 Tax=unclassified Brevundimonas TaxID=2622653 RepID=UPI0025B84450|nr:MULTISPECIES: LysE family translocator [unclassified Brevundimonas]
MEQLALFAGIVILAVISPGADFAMVSRTSAVDGQRAGLCVAVGVATACWVHITYAVFGLELVSRWVPDLLDIIRYAGVAYLLYLGLRMILPARAKAASGDIASGSEGRGRHFWLGFVTNALNPKTSIFVISLYAQVVGHDTAVQVKLAYGALISAIHLMWFALVAFFLSREAVRQYVNRNRRTIDRIIGALLIALGIGLLFWAMP